MQKVNRGDFSDCFKYIIWDDKNEKLISINDT